MSGFAASAPLRPLPAENRFLGRFHTVFRVALLLAAAALATADSTPYSAVCFVVLALAAWVSRGRVERAGRGWPSLAVTAAVLAATAAALAEYSYLRVPVIIALGHYMVAVQAARLMERKRNRDHSQLLLLSALVMIIAAVLSSSVLFALFLLLYLGVAGYAVLLLQLKREGDRRRDRLVSGGVDPAWVAAADPLPDLSAAGPLLRFGAAAGAAVLTGGFLLNLALPRGMGGFLGDWQARPSQRTTGFEETVDFSRSGKIEQDDTVVLHVRVSDVADGRPLGPAELPPDGLLLRGATQEEFNGAQWSSHPYGGNRLSRDPAETGQILRQLRSAADAGRLVRQEITLYNAEGRNLFAMYPPVGLEGVPGSGAALDRLDLTLRCREPLRGTHRYVVDSFLPGAGAAAPAAAEADATARTFRHPNGRRYLPLPGPDYAAGLRHYRPTMQLVAGKTWESPQERRERHRAAETELEELVARVLADSRLPADAPPRARVQALTDWLSGPTFKYSLDAPPAINDNHRPVMDFLTGGPELRQGSCQFFASALVLMCRTKAVGVPSRLVTGFKCSEYNESGGFYIARAKDAHAWAEVHLGDQGWVAFDPTPAAEAAAEPFWLFKRAREFYDLLDHHWGRMVLSYDRNRHEAVTGGLMTWLFERLGAAGSMAETGPAEAVSPTGWLPEWLTDGPGSAVIGGALAVAGVWLLLGGRLPQWTLSLSWFRRKATPQVPTASAAAGPPPEFYAPLLTAVSRSGVEKLPSATPMAFARALAAAEPARFSDLPRMMGYLYQVRHGGVPLTPEQQADLAAVTAGLRDGSRN